MLVPRRKMIYTVAAFTLLVFFSCGHAVKTIPKVELNRTAPHTILLRNETNSTLKILPAKDEVSEAPIVLAPGDTTPLSLQLFKIADLEKTGREWWRLIHGSETYIIESTTPIDYIDIAGENGLIRMQSHEVTLWELLLDLEICLEQLTPNIIDEIDVEGPPEAGIPIDLCE